ASFQYLHKLNVDGVKIDGAYIRKVLNSPRDATMVKNMVQMCHEMGVYVVAEMVESEEQRVFLDSIGVDKGQGWLFGKAEPEPLPIEAE
ncbi:MAG: EAL domain-containing protein, partial [Alphaproteobacteria bacterium]|nr:EAL domain-containing protein [Alphaproteobacteria bacterium]